VTVPVVSEIEGVRHEVARAREAGLTIGLVPTMGALHDGHTSLIQAARQETGFVVVSIFVNPTQFGPKEDFSRYPRTPDQDLAICTGAGVNLVFLPEASIIYPPGFRTFVEVRDLQDILEGASRPGHFRGVATVVLKLFNIVRPDIAYFGQKDFQQVRIIQQMVRDLDLPVQLRICPIVRQADGLALSSRNRYLGPDQRRYATVLFRALEEVRAVFEAGERDARRLRRGMVAAIEATPAAVLDYAVIVDADSLQPVDAIQREVLVALAVKFGSIRLIDNLKLYPR
jgi:pantoate--beta-alanine ligase